MTAGFGSTLARAVAHGNKIQYKSNILSTKRRAVLQCELSAHEWGCLNFIIHWPLYAYCGLGMVYQTMKIIRKVPKHFNNLNDCQQTETKINQRDIPCFRTKYTLCTDLDIVVTSSRVCTWTISISNRKACFQFRPDALTSILNRRSWSAPVDLNG